MAVIQGAIQNFKKPKKETGFLKFAPVSTLQNMNTQAQGIVGNVLQGAYNLGADISKIQRGTIGQDTGIPQGFLGNQAQIFQQAGQNISEASQRQATGQQGAMETSFQQVGQAPAVVGKTISNIFGSALSTVASPELKQTGGEVIQNIFETAKGKKALEVMQGIQKGYEGLSPRTQANLAPVLGVGEIGLNLAPLPGAGKVGQVIGKGLEKAPGLVEAGVKKLPGMVTPVIEKAGAKVGAVKTGVSGTSERLATGLTKEQVKGFQSNPYQAEEFTKLTQRLESPEGISDVKDYKVERLGEVTKQLTDEIDKIRSAKGETSQVYKAVRQSPTQIQTKQLFDDFKTTIKANGMKIDGKGNILRMPGSKAKDLNASDISKFNQLYKDLKADAKKGFLTADEILTFRKTASDLAKYDATTTTTGQSVMKGLRKDIDNTAKAQIKGLKELDAKFVDRLDEFENAVKDLVYKGGDVKGEWRSNIVNIIGTLDRANRAKLLSRLEDVVPGIGEKIKAIDNIPTLLKSLTDKGPFEKWTGFVGATALATTLGAVIPVIGHALGFIVGLAGGKILEAGITGFRKMALTKVLSKISKEGIETLKKIDKKIKEKKLLTEQEKAYLNNLKKQYETEIKNTSVKPNTSTRGKSGNTSNSSNMVNSTKSSVKPNILKKPLTIKKVLTKPQTPFKKKIVDIKSKILKAREKVSEKKSLKDTTDYTKNTEPQNIDIDRLPKKGETSLQKFERMFDELDTPKAIKESIDKLETQIKEWNKLYEKTGDIKYRSFISKGERQLENLKNGLDTKVLTKPHIARFNNTTTESKIHNTLQIKKQEKIAKDKFNELNNQSSLGKEDSTIDLYDSRGVVIDTIKPSNYRKIDLYFSHNGKKYGTEYNNTTKSIDLVDGDGNIIKTYPVKGVSTDNSIRWSPTILPTEEWDNVFQKISKYIAEIDSPINKVADNQMGLGRMVKSLKTNQLKSDIKYLKNPTPENITSTIEKSLGIKGKTEQIKKIVSDFIKKEGAKWKEKIGEMLDEIATKIGAKLNLFGGEGAKGIQVSQLDKAKALDRMGINPDKIWESTGWEKGADGKWRFEIDDSKAKIKEFTEENIGWGNSRDFKAGNGFSDTLDKILEHPTLFKQYPEIKDIRVRVLESDTKAASFTPERNIISIGKNVNKSTLLHEIQHYIQTKEKFAVGGDIDSFVSKSGLQDDIQRIKNKIKDIDKNIEQATDMGYPDTYKFSGKTVKEIEIEKKKLLSDLKIALKNYDNYIEPFEGYKRLGGETEARNVETRLLKPTKLRPELTEDIPRSKQIIKKDGGISNFISDKGTGISGKIEAPKELIEEAKKMPSSSNIISNKQGLMDFVKTIRNEDYYTDIGKGLKLNYKAYRDNSYIIMKGDEKVLLRNITDLHNYLRKSGYYSKNQIK